MENLSGADIIRQLKIENPDISIEDVLDKTREILFKRKLEIAGEHSNVFQFLKALIKLDMTREELGRALPGLSHLDDAIEFINEIPEEPRPSCLPWRTAAKGKTQGTSHQRS
jgi:hypothetical protein